MSSIRHTTHPAYGANGRGEPSRIPVQVDCDACPAKGGADGGACQDCIVDYLLGREEDDAVVHDICEERALRLLGQAGLLEEVVGRMGHAEADRRYATA